MCPAFISPRTVYFFLSHMYNFLISKWAVYKLPGMILLWLQRIMWRLQVTAVKLQDQLQDTSRTQGTSVWTCYFVITSYFWSQGFLRKTGNQSFYALAVGINRSSHILSTVATLHCKIFHASSLSVSALQSKKEGQMTSNWYVTYFQTVELSIPQLNLGLLNTPHINYIKLQEFTRN